MDRQKALQEGAVYLGLYLVLMFITLWVPVLGLVTFLFLPVPFIFFTYKYDLKAGAVLATLSFFFLFIIFGPLALPLTMLFSVSGVVIGELFRLKKPAFAVLAGGSFSFIGSIVLIFVGSVLLLDVNPVEEIQNVMIESAEMSEDMMFFMGDEEAVSTEAVTEMIDEMAVIAPALMVMAGAGLALAVQLIAYWMLKRKKYEPVRFPPFREWGFPKAFIWYYLITYIFILIGVDEGTAIHTAVANLATGLEAVMVIQGFAFMFFYFHRKRLSPVIPVLLVGVSFLLPVFLHIIRILGIIDLGFDLRKRMNEQK
ncbi:YybS family protein [Salipaludibacillus aurantiacus]|uniref:Uncharacterized conserved protein YybS, DUF2232 family n=1 Tax=Salipaludibacillus aurantiacus TaxID=1601833 RepID=A0A1H9VLY6_9BACI|nr:YybS family protein [Salipaludibacillus aurantiacus]SES22538.1 Uncharacterized conserved protein YybS, DUF2232 family [Salipaludibacillus aurantiacus]